MISNIEILFNILLDLNKDKDLKESAWIKYMHTILIIFHLA